LLLIDARDAKLEGAGLAAALTELRRSAQTPAFIVQRCQSSVHQPDIFAASNADAGEPPIGPLDIGSACLRICGVYIEDEAAPMGKGESGQS